MAVAAQVGDRFRFDRARASERLPVVFWALLHAATQALSRQLSRAERGKSKSEFYAAATASCYCASASARKVRSVGREMRCRCRLNVLWTAACVLRKRWEDRADLNRCIL